MEEKVEVMLKLIQEDGDSFAKRAEMYYKRRPELINFVEESFRAYRSIAERYDKISTELQNANNTIATVFPERVQFAMDEDDDDNRSPRVNKFSQTPPKPNNIPKVPNLPKNKDLKGLLTSATKNIQAKKGLKSAFSGGSTVAKSGLTKPQAIEEIDKLQKGVLALQTEKEYVKSSYENGLAAYWELEKIISEKQDRIYRLQDEFNVGQVIEDDDARNLMVTTALRSCHETLAKLQEQQEHLSEEAKVEQGRIKDAQKKLNSLKNDGVKTVNDTEEEELGIGPQEKELELLREKIKMYFEEGSNATLTVTEMVENIEELVNKVIILETAVLSQTALLKRLRTETDDLQAQISSLEGDKTTIINHSDDMSGKLTELGRRLNEIQELNKSFEDQNDNIQTHCSLDHSSSDDISSKLTEMGGKFNEIQELNKSFEDQNNNLQTHFTQAHCSLDHLTELHTMKPDEEPEASVTIDKEDGSLNELESPKGSKVEDNSPDPVVNLEKTEDIKDTTEKEVKVDPLHKNNEDDPYRLFQTPKMQEKIVKQDLLPQTNNDEDEPNWRQLFMNGLADREKILLKEYTSILRNFKEVKKQLGEVEKKNQDSMKEMRNTNGAKDEEIQSLRQKLSFLVLTLDDNPDLKELKDSYHHPTLNLVDDEKVEPMKTGSDKKLTATKLEKEIKVIQVDQLRASSAIEEKFRRKIDEVLEENLDFWLNFSSSFHQIQKFQTRIEDLQAEISKLESKLKKKQDGSIVKDTSLKSDARPIYKHLREIETELTLWLEQSTLLKDESQARFKALCTIEKEISEALKTDSEYNEGAAKFTSYQAGKFQGEVLNMKQENSKVAEELQAGLDLAMSLQIDIQKSLAKLDEDFELSGTNKNNNNQEATLKHSTSRSRIPLRSFIFGVKQKKQRLSIFSSIHPVLHRKLNDHRSGHTS